MTKAQRLVMEKEAEAQRKIQDKDARLDRLKEIMASHQRPGQQPRTPQVSRGRHAAAATPATTRAERAVSFSCSLRVFSFCRKRRFMPLLQNRPNRLNQIISRFWSLITDNLPDWFLTFESMCLKSIGNSCTNQSKRIKLCKEVSLCISPKSNFQRNLRKRSVSASRVLDDQSDDPSLTPRVKQASASNIRDENRAPSKPQRSAERTGRPVQPVIFMTVIPALVSST